MITMDVNQDLRQNVEPVNNLEIRSTKYLKRISLITLFIAQFLLSQLVLSYGIYSVYFVEHNVTFINILWPPIIFLATTKISSPWLQVIAESEYDKYFRWLIFIGTILCSIGTAICYFLTNHIVYCGVVYGIIGGLGSTIIMSVLHFHLAELFPYDTNLVLGINHLGIACGLFVTPVIIKKLFDEFSISFVFLIHGSVLLHIIIAGLLVGKKKNTGKQLTVYNNLGTNDTYEEEMVDLSLTSRSWKSPSDVSAQDEDYSFLEDKESPVLSVKNKNSPRILSLIIEEDEYESDGERSKRSSVIIDKNIKRMSVITDKLEDVIQKEVEPQNGVVLIPPTNIETMNLSLSVDQNLNKQENYFCCTPYQKYRCKKHTKSCCSCIYDELLKPIIESIQVIEFYPSLLTNIHSMLSPVIFLNFIIFRSIDIKKGINLSEIAFMFPVMAFAYLVFLITLPWLTEISRRNLKYVYIFGCIISSLGVYMATKTNEEDYIIISCLIYGFGFGAESFLKERVLQFSLGISKWSRIENTLNCLSGIFFLVTIFLFRDLFGTQNEINGSKHIAKWLNFIFCNHIIVSSIWLIFPLINYLFDSLFYKNRGTYNFS